MINLNPFFDGAAQDAPYPIHVHDLPFPAQYVTCPPFDEGDDVVQWTEEDVVWLHWRLLLELRRLPDPATPLEEKFDTLAWVFSEPDLESGPFSFANCLRVVGTSPLSPTAYFGLLEVDEIRTWIRAHARRWIRATIERFPDWAQDLILRNPGWVASNLARNPQWMNEQIKRHEALPQGDLFDGVAQRH